MFISSLWDFKEPTHYSKRAGHEVPSVVAVLCESMGGYREGDMPRMGLSVPFRYHVALVCKRCRKKIPKIGENQIKIDRVRCELGAYCYTRLLTHSGGHLGILRNT